MQSLERRQLRDPAPSRTSYRMQRVWLTPIYRSLIRTGLPLCLIFGAGLFYLKDPAVMQQVTTSIATARSHIEARPEFEVRLMRMEGASKELAKTIRNAVALEFPISSFVLDLSEIKQKIESFDAVKDADIYLRSGGVLDVLINQRQPVVVWRNAATLQALDAGGQRVGYLQSRSDHSDLPLVSGLGANREVPQALQIFSAAGHIATRVRGLTRIGARRWDLVLDRDQVIQLPEANPVSALIRVIALHSVRDVLNRDVAVVDMRNERRPVLRLTPIAMQEFRRLRAVTSGEDA